MNKWLVPSLVVTVALLMMASRAFQQDSPAKPGNGAATKPDSLRKPGFIFLELETPKFEDYASYFEAVADFKVTERKGRFVVLQSGLAQLMLMHPDELPKGHPFYQNCTGKAQGMGVEIGIVVADVEKAFAEALKFKTKNWAISTGIGMRPWGVRDFRVLAPDGYYLRFTEGPKS